MEQILLKWASVLGAFARLVFKLALVILSLVLLLSVLMLLMALVDISLLMEAVHAQVTLLKHLLEEQIL